MPSATRKRRFKGVAEPECLFGKIDRAYVDVLASPKKASEMADSLATTGFWAQRQNLRVKLSHALNLLAALKIGADVMTSGISTGDWLILAAIIAIEVCWPLWVWVIRKIQLRRTFELRLVTATLPRNCEPQGMQPLDIRVAVHSTTHIQRFNLRFVTEKKRRFRKRVFVNVSSNVIAIQSVGGFDQVSVAPRDDGEGGVDCIFGSGQLHKVYARKTLDLRVFFRATEDWSGYLSFHGYDADENERFSRAPFSVVRHE